MNRADLHVHTSASDGLLAPADLVREAKRVGLACIGVTDHDTVGGIAESLAAGEELGIEVVPGIELSTVQGKEEYHIVGYFIDWRNESLKEWLAETIASRGRRAVDMVANLRGAGYEIELDRVREIAGGEFIGRPHIAEALREKGYVKVVGDAFSAKMIGKESPLYVERRTVSSEDGIAIVMKYGGVPVLAHPGGLATGGQVEEPELSSLVDMGLKGIEAACPKHSKAQVDEYQRITRKYGLIETAGTDFHGIKGCAPLGTCWVQTTAVAELKSQAGTIVQ